ncbi:MAG: hypothetical protein IKU52_05345 [Clostridia bacterium]|nr:hypothetical protein [Clostridia bacterium]
MEKIKGCYVFYHPNGGVWGDGTTEPKPAPNGGILDERDVFVWPEGTEKMSREGYRMHTSQNYLNVIRFYTADGKGNGFDPEKICNGFGYDCWPSNSWEITNQGHDANWFSKNGMKKNDGDTVYLYMCWDPIIIYDMGEVKIREFVYKTDGDEYTILGTGGKTNYARNRMNYNTEGYEGPFEIPETSKKLAGWKDEKGNIFEIGKEYTVTEPLTLYAIFE